MSACCPVHLCSKQENNFNREKEEGREREERTHGQIRAEEEGRIR